MLKDLRRDDWLAFLALDPARIPPVLILRGTRNLRTRFDQHRALFADVDDVGSPNGLFEDVFIGRHRGVDVGYASVYGASMASEITHVFGALGTRLVIQTGVCGALGDGIAAGDLVVATEAGCGDGAAACYVLGIERATASPELVEWVCGAVAGINPCRRGPIWTTAALLAEGDAEIAGWHRAGYLAVDMETATTFAVAEHFGMRRLSLLVVFDNPRQGAHIALTEHDKTGARLRGEEVMRRLVFALIHLPGLSLKPHSRRVS
jgi:uridine phosphorylase